MDTVIARHEMPLSRKPLPDSKGLPGGGGKKTGDVRTICPIGVPRGQLRMPLHYVQGHTHWSQGH